MLAKLSGKKLKNIIESSTDTLSTWANYHYLFGTPEANDFIKEVEDLRRSKNMEYIDAVVHWCEKNKVEIEYAASYIKKDQVFKYKIQEEAENLNYMKRSARLPI